MLYAPVRKTYHPRRTAMGRRQAVRQRILIPSYGGSIPPAPATLHVRLPCLIRYPRQSAGAAGAISIEVAGRRGLPQFADSRVHGLPPLHPGGVALLSHFRGALAGDCLCAEPMKLDHRLCGLLAVVVLHGCFSRLMRWRTRHRMAET